MGIERVTPWPGVYAGEPETWEIPRLEAEADALWKIRAKDKFYLVLPIAMRKRLSSVCLTQLKADPRCIIHQDTYDFDIAMDRPSSGAMGRVLLVVRRIILYAMEETGKGSVVAIS